MGVFTKKKETEVIQVDVDGDLISIIEITIQFFHNGACQCFGNCDCYLDNGKLLGEHTFYSHPLLTKRYNDLKTCIQSFKTKLKDILDYYNTL